MDNQKIGKFIAELRKGQNLTQEQLGEKLGVTNKTVSRWETGVYLPPAEKLILMSEIFSVSINEILSGERLDKDEYMQAAEENLKAALRSSSFSLKEKIGYFKKKWLKEHIAFMILCGVIVVSLFIAGLIMKRDVIVSVSVILPVVFYGAINNSMMAYVEKNAFDGKGTGE